MIASTPSRLRRHYSHRRLLLSMLVLALATALLRGWLPFLYAPRYSPDTMTPLTTQRTTHCIGRYLIDLPSNFELRTGGWGDIELYYGLDKNFERVYATVKQGRYTSEEFWDEVNARRFGLGSAVNSATKGSMLLHGEQLGNSSALLRRLGDEHYGSSIKTEVHVLVGPRYVTLEQESYSRDENDITYLNADPGPAEARLKMIASQLLPYENAARAKPGFCMQGVLFDVGQDDETAKFMFEAKDIPDVHLDVHYHAVTGQPRIGLYERVDEAERRLLQMKLATVVFRRGDRPLGGEPAEELLSKLARPAIHNFKIERRDNAPRSLDRPFFSLALNTGNEYMVAVVDPSERPDNTEKVFYSSQDKAMVHRMGDSSLSDEQVLKLWDEVVASVRKR